MNNIRSKLKLRKVIFVLFLSIIPLTVIVLFISGSENLSLMVALVIAALIFILNMIVSSTKCPSCGKLFFGRQKGIVVVWKFDPKRCANCGYEIAKMEKD